MRKGIASELDKRLDLEEPRLQTKRIAGVAVIVTGEDGPETLLIKRAEHAGDPWSGQVAFPGGKVQEGDATLKEATARETREEVGIDLERAARFLGYAGPFRTHTGDMDVVPLVFLLPGRVEIRTNAEVASYRWIPWEVFGSPESKAVYRFDWNGTFREMPAFAVGDYLVWGLTHRIVSAMIGDDRA